MRNLTITHSTVEKELAAASSFQLNKPLSIIKFQMLKLTAVHREEMF